MQLIDLLLITTVPAVVVLIVVGIIVVAWSRADVPEPEGEEPGKSEPPASSAIAADSARVRVVTIVRTRDTLVIDGLVDAEGPGLRLPEGTPVALEIAAPNSFWLDLSIERLMETWAADNRVIDVTLRRHPSGPVISLCSKGSVVNLPLLSETPLGT